MKIVDYPQKLKDAHNVQFSTMLSKNLTVLLGYACLQGIL